MKWKLPYTSVGEVTVMLFPLAYRRVEGVGRGICLVCGHRGTKN